MLRFCLLLSSFLFFCGIETQAQYKGGKGSGYASLRFQVEITHYEENPLSFFDCYPNPIHKGQFLHFRFSSKSSFLSIGVHITDIMGKEVERFIISPAQLQNTEEYRFLPNLKSGVYCIWLENEKFYEKRYIVVL